MVTPNKRVMPTSHNCRHLDNSLSDFDKTLQLLTSLLNCGKLLLDRHAGVSSSEFATNFRVGSLWGSVTHLLKELQKFLL